MTASGGLVNLTPAYVVVLVLMTMRISAVLLTTPILGSRSVPALTKVGLAVVLALVLLPITAPKVDVPLSFAQFLMAMGKEVAIGLMAGFAISLLYAALQLVSSLAGIQIGFGFSGTIDINYAGQTPLLDPLFTGLATLIFLTGNFHHQFLIGVQGLFDMLPPNGFSLFSFSPDGLLQLSANMFVIALRVVLPLLGALLLTDLALGVMARTAPQMNVFFVGMPVKIGIGVFALAVMMPFVVSRIEIIFGSLASDMAVILR